MFSLFFAIAMVFGGLIYATRANVVSSEMRSARAQTEQLLLAIDHEFAAVRTFALDWSHWDELYDFARGEDAAFYENNIDPEWFHEVDIDLVAIFDHSGDPRLVWAGDSTGKLDGVDPARMGDLIEESGLLDVSMMDRETRGVIVYGSVPFLASSSVIVTSQGEGPAAGVAVFGRRLDTAIFSDLGGFDDGALEAFRADDAALPAGAKQALAELTTDEPYSVSLARPHTLTAHALLFGPDDTPVVVLEADVESVGYRGTPELLAWITAALLIMGLVWSKYTFSLMENASLTRMSWLKNAVTTLIESGDHSRRLDVASISHGDEITDVAEEVNALLDATELAHAARVESEQRNRALIENMADSVFVVDMEGIVTYASPQAESLTGLPPDMIRGMHYRELLSPESRAVIASVIETRGRLDERLVLDVSFVRVDAKTVPAELAVSAVRNPYREPIAMQWIARDVAERKRFEQQLVRLANYDHLTGLRNRRRFEEELTRQLAESRRYGSSSSLLWLDLDGFKDINDAFGHGAGDDILIAVAETLRSASRAEHIIARIGGDEFAVLIPRAMEQEALVAASRLLEELRVSLARRVGTGMRVTASIGIATFPEHATNAEELLSRADLAMYSAKQHGRNRVGVYTPEANWETELSERHTWAARIESALAEGRLVAFAQPIVDITTDDVSSYEMLVRLDEDGRIVSPGEFLAHAEKLDLVNEIDRWMLSEALAILRGCSDNRVRLTVNLSGTAFGDETFLARVKRDIRASGIDPDRLGFEITETALIRNIGQAIHFIGALREVGCSFSLDDFGSGFSSFYYLRHLPIDVLKIDGGLVRELVRNPSDRHVVKAIIELCRGLGLLSTAECVEDEATMALLREFGVDYVQGFHIAKPMPARELLLGEPTGEPGEVDADA